MAMTEAELTGYTDATLSELISDNVKILRELIGKDLDDVYEEEFGQPHEETTSQRGDLASPRLVANQKALDRTRALERQIDDLKAAREDVLLGKQMMEKEFEKSMDDSRYFHHHFESLYSQLKKNNENRLEHLNLLERFEGLGRQLRQADETSDKLSAKLEVREQILRDNERIREVMVKEKGHFHMGDEERGGGFSFASTSGHEPHGAGSAADYPDLGPQQHDDGANQLFYLADSAATALELEKVRAMLLRAGERLKEVDKERKEATGSAATLNMQVDKAVKANREILVEIAHLQAAQRSRKEFGAEDFESAATSASGSSYFTVPDLSQYRAGLTMPNLETPQGDRGSSTIAEKDDGGEALSGGEETFTSRKSPVEFSSRIADSVPSSAFATTEKGGDTNPRESLSTPVTQMQQYKTPKLSPTTRRRVPKTLGKHQILHRLQQIEERRARVFDALSVDEAKHIAEDELEEKVLRRRLKKVLARESTSS